MKVRYGPGWWHPEANIFRDIQEFREDAEEDYRARVGGRVSIGNIITLQVESDSRPGVWYTLQLDGAGRWTCTCPGFYHREDCKHVTRAREGKL